MLKECSDDDRSSQFSCARMSGIAVKLTHGQKLQVLLDVDYRGRSTEEVAEELGVSVDVITSILQRKATLERPRTSATQRKHLTLEDKLRVLYFLDRGLSRREVQSKFQIPSRTVTRICKMRVQLQQLDSNGASLSLRRLPRSMYPDVEQDVVAFITYVRSQRMPVTLELLRARAIQSARQHRHDSFRASNGWIEKFLRRSPVQPSFRLHGKADSQLPLGHAERLEEIRNIVFQYSMANVYNVDESGLFHRCGPSRTYLMQNEQRETTRGTSFQKHKNRVTVTLCVNADGSHILPVVYIGSSREPRCFRTGRYEHLRSRYFSQKNGWMDSAGFEKWVRWWYNEVRSKGVEGPLLLIMDNCGGHEDSIDLPGLQIVFLPPRSTAVNQALDLGLIAHGKMRYRSVLLRMVIDVMLELNSSDGAPLHPTSEQGKWGLQQGHLPHVGDAMTIFDEAWSATSKETVIKCWIKSQCLPPAYVEKARDILLAPRGEEIQLNLDEPISQSTSETLNKDLVSARVLSDPRTPLSELLADVSIEAQDASYFQAILNSPAPFDADIPTVEISCKQLQAMYDNDQDLQGTPAVESRPQPAVVTEDQVASLTSLLKNTNDIDLRAALERAIDRAKELQTQTSSA